MNYTDYLRLNELKIFKNVRNSLPKGLTKSTNLLTVKDGVLYTWDFDNNCVLTLNVKAARSRDGDNVSHQNLLPLLPVVFQPEFLLANDSGSLLVVAGSSGILVMELPPRCPPFGAFENNKDVVYCRSYSLDERLLFCSEVVKVRQVRFHPGSTKNTHILALTSDNTLRLYNIENHTALNVANYQIGETPVGVFPGTKTSYLAAFGEVGVDFDFGQPEISSDTKSLFVKERNFSNLVWPVYVLRGDGRIVCVNVALDKVKPKVTLVVNTNQEDPTEEACSIICLNTIPEVLCVSNSNGTIYHSILLPVEEKTEPSNSQKELLCFESIELELSLSTTTEDSSYTCPIFLHKDESRPGRFFATHSGGIHSVTISCIKDLQHFASGTNDDSPLEDVFNQPSKAEYLVCTKTSSSDKVNPIVGFSLYYEPTSLIAILADGSLLSLGILTAEVLPKVGEDFEDTKGEVTSPLKKMLKEPFDLKIETLLKKTSNHPILKLSDGKRSQKECYELIKRASPIFREQIDNHRRAHELIEKQVKALQMLKDFQLKQIDRMNAEKHSLREKAENLAEKYEDIKDKQDEMMKRCEKLLVLVSQERSVPSDAEKQYLEQLEQYMEKIEKYKASIEKLKMKVKYQNIQIANWKAQEEKKSSSLSETHSTTIRNNLKETSERIQEMVKEITEYKERLNLK